MGKLRLLFIFTALLAGSLHAQPAKHLRYLPKALSSTSSRRLLAPVNRRVQASALAAAKQRADVRLSVARLDHAILMDTPMNKRPHSTAFLFKTRYAGTEVIWAATAGHVAQLKEKVVLTFYNGKKEIQVPGTLVQQGPALLSDMALIRLDKLPDQLRPLTLTTQINPQEKLTTWGYASNKLYQINNLTFEKDNTRFLRTNFPAEQTKRSGLCGGPLLNTQGEVLGIHCGSTWEDKSFASSVRMIPYLLEAYYEGNAQVPIIAKGIDFGSIDLNERIIYIQCMDEQGKLINQEDIYDQLPQSLLMSLYQDPEVRYLRFLLGSYQQDLPIYRVLVYDKQTATHHFEPLKSQQNLYK